MYIPPVEVLTMATPTCYKLRMTSTKDLIDWLQSLPPESSVGVDEGGLTLVVLDENDKVGEAYYEVGGVPEETFDQDATRENG